MPGKIASTDFAFPVTFEIQIPAASGAAAFEQVQPQTSLNDKIGWIIHRAEFFMPVDAYAMFADASADFSVEFGMANANSWTVPQADNPSIKVRNRELFIGQTSPSSATAKFAVPIQPAVQDFTTLPGGGLLVLPFPMYGYAYVGGTHPGAGLVVNAYFRLLVSQVQLSDADFFAILTANQLLISN